MNTLTIRCILAVALLAGAAAPQAEVAPGASVRLPAFDPTRSFEQLAQGMRRLDPVAESMRKATATIGPLLDEYRANPSLENMAELEGAVAGLTSEMARRIRGALAARETVTFAFQDIVRGVRELQGTLVAKGGQLGRELDLERRSLVQASDELRAAAEAVEAARDDAERAARMEAFKRLHAARQRHKLKAGLLETVSANYAKLAVGADQLAGGLLLVQGRVEELFDRVGDAGDLLEFSAGYRADATELVGQFESLFGEQAAVAQIIEGLRTVDGQLALFQRTTSVLDAQGTVQPLLERLGELTAQLFTAPSLTADGGLSPVTSPDAYWDAELKKVLDDLP